jgi:hypothetical protein
MGSSMSSSSDYSYGSSDYSYRAGGGFEWNSSGSSRFKGSPFSSDSFNYDSPLFSSSAFHGSSLGPDFDLDIGGPSFSTSSEFRKSRPGSLDISNFASSSSRADALFDGAGLSSMGSRLAMSRAANYDLLNTALGQPRHESMIASHDKSLFLDPLLVLRSRLEDFDKKNTGVSCDADILIAI